MLERKEANDIRSAVFDKVAAETKRTQGSNRVGGKVGVITGVGPSAGIGTHAARLFAREGAAHLYLLDVSGDLPTFSATLAKEYPKTKVSHVVGDAASPDVVKALVDRVISEEGHLDFYFANAGVSQLRPKETNPPGGKRILTSQSRTAEDISADEFMETMRINVLSGYLAIKYAGPAMAHLAAGKTIPGGSIMLTASVAGRLANAGSVPYSASKAAVISLAQTAAYDFTGHNVRINAICPGLIETPMTMALFDMARERGSIGSVGQLNPLLRYGQPQEIAHAALWLASDDSSYVNAQQVTVDGGLTGSAPNARQYVKKTKAKL